MTKQSYLNAKKRDIPLTTEQIKHQQEQSLLNKFKSDNAMGKADKVYIKAVGILRRKKQERIAEMEELDRLDDLEAMRENRLNNIPKETIKIPDTYFQDILKNAELASNDITADNLVSGEINLEIIRKLARREKNYLANPSSTDTSRELKAVTRKFIQKLGLNPTASQLKTVLSESYKASAQRMNESLLSKASALVAGKSFKRLLSEMNINNEDYATSVALRPLVRIEKQASKRSVKAREVLSFKQFMEQK